MKRSEREGRREIKKRCSKIEKERKEEGEKRSN